MRANLNKTLANFIQKSNAWQKCCYSTSTKPVSKVVSMAQSINDKGFLRPYKAYEAPPNAADKIEVICATLKIPNKTYYKFKSLDEKYQVLQACFDDFNHSVPNSMLYELKTVGDVIKFYKTSVSSTVPYEAFKQQQLPENLHIQYDYVRFNPETDTKFNGQTAFPKSSTLVTGLKYRGKYQGHEAKTSWP